RRHTRFSRDWSSDVCSSDLATRYPRQKFVPLTILGGTTWALYSAFVGRLVGGWFESQPLLGAAVAICVAVVLGVGIDHLIQRFKIGRASCRGGVWVLGRAV